MFSSHFSFSIDLFFPFSKKLQTILEKESSKYKQQEKDPLTLVHHSLAQIRICPHGITNHKKNNWKKVSKMYFEQKHPIFSPITQVCNKNGFDSC